MTIKDVVILIVGIFLALLYIALVIRDVIKKKKNRKSADLLQSMAEIAQKVIPLVGAAEIAYKSVSDKKTGALKLKDVLNDIKDMCAEKSIPFNKPYWTDYIKEAVELINIDREPAEIPTETTAEVK